MSKPAALEYGVYYHIFDRGNNRENVFFEERNYRHFLNLYATYIEPVADTYAYCLLRNHFHLLVRIKTAEQQTVRVPDQTLRVLNPSQQFSNLLNAYAKAVNKAYGRTGSLFENPFGRIPVTAEAHFAQLVVYIHFNPQKHGFVDDSRTWPYSSYAAMLSSQPTRLQKGAVLAWFDGPGGFAAWHARGPEEGTIAPLVAQDFV